MPRLSSATQTYAARRRGRLGRMGTAPGQVLLRCLAVNTTAKIPSPPTRPHEDECCRRGCDPCIFDYYESALDRWYERVRKLGGDPDAILRQMSPPAP